MHCCFFCRTLVSMQRVLLYAYASKLTLRKINEPQLLSQLLSCIFELSSDVFPQVQRNLGYKFPIRCTYEGVKHYLQSLSTYLKQSCSLNLQQLAGCTSSSTCSSIFGMLLHSFLVGRRLERMSKFNERQSFVLAVR